MKLNPGNLARDILHLFVFFSFAIAQPIFDLFSRNPEFFVAHQSQAIDILIFIFFLSFLLPIPFALAEAIAWMSGPRLQKSVHAILIWGLVVLISLPLLKSFGTLPGYLLLIVIGLTSFMVCFAYFYFITARLFVSVLSPAIFIFPLYLTFFSPVSNVIFPKTGATHFSPKVESKTPIVFVVFDELPLSSLLNEKGQIDPIRYPHFASFAQDAYWFRNATSISDQTLISIPAILTGNYPKLGSSPVPTEDSYPNTIFFLFKDSHRMVVSETFTELCPNQICSRNRKEESFSSRLITLFEDSFVAYLHIITPNSLTGYLPKVEGTWKDFRNKRKRKDSVDLRDKSHTFSLFLDSIQNTDKPGLYYLHIMLPHVPWKYLPSGKEYYPIGAPLFPHGMLEGDVRGGIWNDREWENIQGFQRHLLQVGYVDNLLGGLLTRLKDLNLYDKSLIVITADHGVSFRRNDFMRFLTETNYQDILSVPLLIKKPQQREGTIIDDNIETIDIFPTIADILGIRLPWAVDGQAAINVSLPNRPEKIAFRNRANEKLVFGPELNFPDETLRRKIAIFGSGKSSLYKIGPYKEIVGVSVNHFKTGDSDAEGELKNLETYKDVDLTSIFIPAHIEGQIRKDHWSESSAQLAIVVNGIIQAVTQTFENNKNKKKFTAMVPPSAFINGENSIEVFIIPPKWNREILLRTQSK